MDEEEQKEKTGEIKRATHDDDDRSQPDNIPVDLTLEILSRLPAKSIVRYRCVCKLWSSLTTLPSFISSFVSRSSSRSPRLLVTITVSQSKVLVITFPQHQNPDGSYPPVYSYQITSNPNDFREYRLSESVQGLFLLDGFKIWNPSLRRFSSLPHPKKNIPMSYLGYDPLEDKHKVVCVYHVTISQQAQVLTLGAQESWRIINQMDCLKYSPIGRHGRCFNGILYYEAIYHSGGLNLIMSFDVNSEKFKPIKCPKTCSRSAPRTMSPYEGRLALVDYSKPFGDVDLYILKDANGDEWTHKRFLHVPCNSGWRDLIHFKGITDAGELIFAPTRVFDESFYVLYFDPRRNSIREALFEGFVGEEFSGSVYNTNVSPNHIESLVSLS